MGQFTGMVLQFWFWLTPIIYTLPALPEQARELMQLNPLQPLMAAYQSVFRGRVAPDYSILLPLAMLPLFFLIVGTRFFLGRAGELVDEL